MAGLPALKIEEVSDAARPVLWFDSEFGYHGFGGTAFCVRYLSAQLVVTARHVLRSTEPTGFRIAREREGECEFVQPTDLYWYNDGPPGEVGDWDHASDVAVGVLDCEIPGAFHADVFDVESAKNGDLLLVVGYPKKHNEMVYDADLEDSPRGELARKVKNRNLSFWNQYTLLGTCTDDWSDIRELREIEFTSLGGAEDLDGMSGSPVMLVTRGEPTCRLAGMFVRGDAAAMRGRFIDGHGLMGYILRVAFKDQRVRDSFIAAAPSELRQQVAERVAFMWGPVPADDGGELQRRREEFVAGVIADANKREPG